MPSMELFFILFGVVFLVAVVSIARNFGGASSSRRSNFSNPSGFFFSQNHPIDPDFSPSESLINCDPSDDEDSNAMNGDCDRAFSS